MILVLSLLFTSVVCLFISLIALGIVLRHVYSRETKTLETHNDEALIISGCDSGIGLELAKHFFHTTKYTIICGLLNPEESDGFQTLSGLSLDDEKARLILTKLDIRSERDINSIVTKIEELKLNGRIKSVAALINNAGILTYGEFDWLTWDHIQSQIDVNLVGTMRLTRAIVPFIIESKGRVINVSSVNDRTIFPGLSVYSATKSALSTFSTGLGYELRKFGAHVVVVRLGDFAKLTNIMSSHEVKQTNMWNEMSSRKREIYGDFFEKFNRHILDNYGMTSPKGFEQSSLYQDFTNALLAIKPPNSITCAPLGFRAFYFVIELLPTWLQYHLLDLLLRIGFCWKAPQVQSTGGMRS